jgi:hypothetical protein
VPDAQVSVSSLCTRCGGSRRDRARPDFFSHRAGRAQRQMGLLGVRADGPPGLQNTR